MNKTLLLFFFGVLNLKICSAHFSFSSVSTTYTQDFQSYEGTLSTVPLHWTNSYTDYDPGGYYSNTGTYTNFNSNRALNQNGSGEYALGAKIGASEGPMNVTLSCINNIPHTIITSLVISWDAEQYSRGGRATTLEFINTLMGLITGTNLFTCFLMRICLLSLWDLVL